MRKLGNRPTLKPNPGLENHDPGGRETATRPWGVLLGKYSAVGKVHYLGKDLTEVRSPQRQLVPDRPGWKHTSQSHCGQ